MWYIKNIDYIKYIQVIKESLEFINPNKKVKFEQINKENDFIKNNENIEKDSIEDEKFIEIENNNK